MGPIGLIRPIKKVCRMKKCLVLFLVMISFVAQATSIVHLTQEVSKRHGVNYLQAKAKVTSAATTESLHTFLKLVEKVPFDGAAASEFGMDLKELLKAMGDDKFSAAFKGLSAQTTQKYIQYLDFGFYENYKKAFPKTWGLLPDQQHMAEVQ